MTKPKHPSVNSIKAGQTVYLICSEWWRKLNPKYYIHQIIVTGKSYQPPREGEGVVFAPVDWLKKRMSSQEFLPVKNDLFYSKRKAQAEAKRKTLVLQKLGDSYA